MDNNRLFNYYEKDYIEMMKTIESITSNDVVSDVDQLEFFLEECHNTLEGMETIISGCNDIINKKERISQYKDKLVKYTNITTEYVYDETCLLSEDNHIYTPLIVVDDINSEESIFKRFVQRLQWFVCCNFKC